MLFLIGSQKSGTTWLRNCLSHVTPISLGQEWYLPELYEAVSGHINSFGRTLSDDERRNAVNASVRDAWLNMIRAATPGAMADKSAYPCLPTKKLPVRNDLHPFAVRIAKNIFPEGKTLVIVRDPRAVYNSWRHYRQALRSRPRSRLGLVGAWVSDWRQTADAEVFARNWAIQNSRWIEDNPNFVVRYEDLKSDFETTLLRMFENIGMAVDPSVLARIYTEEYEIEKTRERQPEIYRKGVIDDWRNHLSAAESQMIELEAGDLMERLGYGAGGAETVPETGLGSVRH